MFGKILNNKVRNLVDLTKTEYLILTPLLIMTIVLGFYPALVLDLISPSVEKISSNMVNYLKFANLGN